MDRAAIDRLKTWFLSQGRDLPWRIEPTPYAVWVSEVMLQQTQVAVVIPYFDRWMQLFPTIEALANAPIELVLKAWEGLGYYARARNLHAGAKYVVDNHGGALPADAEKLKAIKGLGPYTIGAILSFAFRQRKAAVDGNVMRVLSRYYALKDDIARLPSQKKIIGLAEELLPFEEPWIVSEALIELGATVCQRNPQCLQCPLKASCLGLRLGIADELPVKTSQTKVTLLQRAVAVVLSRGSCLVQQGEKGKVMADLWQFPYWEMTPGSACDEESIRSYLEDKLGPQAIWQQALPFYEHSFTRYRAHLFAHLFHLPAQIELPFGKWVPLSKLSQLPFSAGHRRLAGDII